MSEVASGVTALEQRDILAGYVGVDVHFLMESIKVLPCAGRLFYHPAPVTVGRQTFPARVYVVGGHQNDTGIPFKLAQIFAPLARPTQDPYPDFVVDDLVIDAATRAGSLRSGTLGGKSATRVRDLSIFSGWAGSTSAIGTVTATKSGTQLTGKITYNLSSGS